MSDHFRGLRNTSVRQTSQSGWKSDRFGRFRSRHLRHGLAYIRRWELRFGAGFGLTACARGHVVAGCAHHCRPVEEEGRTRRYSKRLSTGGISQIRSKLEGCRFLFAGLMRRGVTLCQPLLPIRHHRLLQTLLPRAKL